MMQLTAPDVLPVLSKGAHDNPLDGACFMEYTALLAGLPFNDHPACTDQWLARLLQVVNDRMPSVTYRAELTPLLGRSIGLVAPDHDHATERLLRREAAKYLREFMAHTRTWGRILAYTGISDLQVFVLVMNEASGLTPSQLVQMATWLHEAFEEAMTELGLDKDAWKPNRSHEEVRAMMVAPQAHCELCEQYPYSSNVIVTSNDAILGGYTIVNNTIKPASAVVSAH